MNKICLSKIWQELNRLNFQHKAQINIFESISSTHEYLKNIKLQSFCLHFCIAEEQTQGRGRHGQTWISPKYENIYASILCKIQKPIHQLQHVSLIVGLACIDILNKEALANPILIKWPNDLIINNKKLAGILIDIKKTNQIETELVISLGLNVHSHPHTIERETTSLKAQTSKNYDRSLLIANIFNKIIHFINIYEQQGFLPFRALWNKVDALQGKIITRTEQGKTVTGKVCGLNEQGWLILEDKTGSKFILQGRID